MEILAKIKRKESTFCPIFTKDKKIKTFSCLCTFNRTVPRDRYIFEREKNLRNIFSVTTPSGYPPPFSLLMCPPCRILRKPWICPLECTVSYISQKLCVFQPSSPLYCIHPLSFVPFSRPCLMSYVPCLTVSLTSPTMSRLVSDIPVSQLCLYYTFRTVD